MNVLTSSAAIGMHHHPYPTHLLLFNFKHEHKVLPDHDNLALQYLLLSITPRQGLTVQSQLLAGFVMVKNFCWELVWDDQNCFPLSSNLNMNPTLQNWKVGFITGSGKSFWIALEYYG